MREALMSLKVTTEVLAVYHPELVRQVMDVLWAHENDPLVLTACIWALDAIIKHEPSTQPTMQEVGVLELLHRFLKMDSFARLPVRRYAIDLITEIWCVAVCFWKTETTAGSR
jgi:hypothetical protein